MSARMAIYVGQPLLAVLLRPAKIDGDSQEWLSYDAGPGIAF